VTLTATPALFARSAPATSAVIARLAADGIPKVALNAYRVAAARINASLPLRYRLVVGGRDRPGGI